MRSTISILLTVAWLSPCRAHGQSITNQISNLQQEQWHLEDELSQLQNQISQRLQPAETPEQRSARYAQYPDVIARVDADWKAAWEKKHPFGLADTQQVSPTSGWQQPGRAFEPPAPPYFYYDNAIREVEAKKQTDAQMELAAIKKRIADLERQFQKTNGSVLESQPRQITKQTLDLGNQHSEQTQVPHVVSAPAISGPSRIGPADPQSLVDGFQVSGVRFAGTDSRVIINGRVFHLNEIVDRDSSLKLVGVAPKSLKFVDGNGKSYEKNF